MPRIAFFYGIGIYLYYSDHAPPHFHAIYAQLTPNSTSARARCSPASSPSEGYDWCRSGPSVTRRS